MICCLHECPNYSATAGETEICTVCDKELMVNHLTDAITEMDRTIEFVDWRFCIDSLRDLDPANGQLDKARELFEALDVARTQLADLFGVAKSRNGSHPRSLS